MGFASSCGLTFPDGGKGFAVDPLFPSEWDYLVLENLRYCGHDVDIRWTRTKGLLVTVDGREAAQRADCGSIVIADLETGSERR